MKIWLFLITLILSANTSAGGQEPTNTDNKILNASTSSASQKINPEKEQTPPLAKISEPTLTTQNAGEKDRQNSEIESNRWTAIFTGISALIAFAQAIFFFVQLKIMKASTKDAAVLAIAAETQARAASESAAMSRISMIAGDRAYVHHNSFRWISHLDPRTEKYFWRLRPSWINSGNTPACAARTVIGYELRDSPLPDDFHFPANIEESTSVTIAPKGIIESAIFDLDCKDLVAIGNNEKYLYAWGTITYRDVFPNTDQRKTKFCVHIVNVSGNPEQAWHSESNPVDIRFATYHKHNCFDEECQ